MGSRARQLRLWLVGCVIVAFWRLVSQVSGSSSSSTWASTSHRVGERERSHLRGQHVKLIQIYAASVLSLARSLSSLSNPFKVSTRPAHFPVRRLSLSVSLLLSWKIYKIRNIALRPDSTFSFVREYATRECVLLFFVFLPFSFV